MWMAIATAVIPLLALPIWLMKTVIILAATIIAGITYSLLHQSKTAVSDLEISTPDDTSSAQEGDNDNVGEEGSESADTEAQERREPVDITDPDTDRFIAQNTYKSRTDRLRN